jgi:hypothetical protein
MERSSPRERHFILWQVYDLMPKLELTLAATNFILGGRGHGQKQVDQLCVDRAFVCDDPAVVAGRCNRETRLLLRGWRPLWILDHRG